MANHLPLIVELGENLALLIALTFLYSLMIRQLSAVPKTPLSLLHGLLFGAIAIIGMQIPIQIADGIIIDGRTVIVMLAGPFAGPWAGLVAGALVSAFHFYLGGAGTLAGIGALMSAAVIGILFAHYFKQKRDQIRVSHLLLLSLVMTVISLLWVFALPAPIDPMVVFGKLLVPVSFMYPLATVILGVMLIYEHERLATVDALLESEKRFSDFAELASDWLWEMDADLRFSYLNDSYWKASGYKKEDIIGKRREEVVSPYISDKERERLQAHFKTLENHLPFKGFEYTTHMKGNEAVRVSISGKPIFHKDGRFLGYRGTSLNITEQNRTKNELFEAKEAAEQASRAKSEFLANMSHELRTPLNAIIGFSQIWMDEIFGPIKNDKYKTYAADINSAGKHLLSLIGDILDVAKVESGETTVSNKTVNLRQLVDSSLLLIREQVRKKGIAVDVEIEPDELALNGDPRLIRQVLVNILNNAAKFTSQGGRITVIASRTPTDETEIVIKDNGCGMPATHLDRVMEPFVQAEQKPDVSQEGTGLGLPLARQIMELHQGSLELESEEEIGTQITLLFPAVRTVLAKAA